MDEEPQGFFKLPAELRHPILREALHSVYLDLYYRNTAEKQFDAHFRFRECLITYTDKLQNPTIVIQPPGLLFVSKPIRHECLSILSHRTSLNILSPPDRVLKKWSKMASTIPSRLRTSIRCIRLFHRDYQDLTCLSDRGRNRLNAFFSSWPNLSRIEIRAYPIRRAHSEAEYNIRMRTAQAAILAHSNIVPLATLTAGPLPVTPQRFFGCLEYRALMDFARNHGVDVCLYVDPFARLPGAAVPVTHGSPDMDQLGRIARARYLIKWDPAQAQPLMKVDVVMLVWHCAAMGVPIERLSH